MAWLARRLGQPFYYVATHEIFHGFRGWLVRRVGAFSVLRGRPDRPSIRMSRRLLAEQDGKLVIFPEGETHMQNDLILPLNPGAIQIGFWSLERLEELGKPARLPVLPVVIKYRSVGNPRSTLLRGLRRLEQALGLPVESGATPRDRLWRAGLTVLAGVEREYGVSVTGAGGAEPTVDERIRALYHFIAARVSHLLHTRPPEERSVPLGMRALFNATFDYLDGLAEGKTPYERRLHARRVTTATACLNDLWRMQNFMVINEGCLAPPLTAERFGEVLWRLEVEVYGRARTRPWREAIVRLGEPIELSDRLLEYHAARKATVARCTVELEERLRGMLASLQSLGTPF
jgi:hypothetical protein